MKRILIVDDEPDITLLVKLNLELTGKYVIREENDAADTLAAAREFRPDLILLDVMMPTMDGGDVVVELKADPDLRHTPVIFLTATVLKEEVDAKGGMIGGYPFIPKPVSVEALIQCIESQLGDGKVEDGQPAGA